MGISMSVADDKKTATMRINGRFDFSLHNDFRKAYKDVSINAGQYAVDLSGTEYLDSSALGMLLLLKEHADSQSSTVRLLGFSDEIKEILTIASFDKIFTLG